MAIYYVRPTNGSNGNTGLSFALAWQTTQYALDNISAGDEVRLCAETEETTSVQIDVDTNAGTFNNRITFVGANGSDGSDDGTQYSIRATGSPSKLLAFGANGKFYTFRNIQFDGNSTADTGVHWTSTSATGNVLDTCEIKRCDFDGILVRVVSTLGGALILNCDVHDNARYGIATDEFYVSVIGGTIHDNGAEGILCNCAGSTFTDFATYGNSIGFKKGSSGERFCLTGITSFGNNSHGFSIQDTGEVDHEYVNCSSSGNGGYGFEFDGATLNNTKYMDYNHTYNNTSGATNLTGGMPGSNNQTGDPLFTNTTPGSEDFTPLTGSPLIDNGLLGHMIGSAALAHSTPSFAAVGDVRTGVDRGDGSVGTMDQLAARYGIVGQSWGTDGTEVDGAFVVPTEATVVDQIEFGYLAEFTGAFTCVGGTSGGLIDGKLAQFAVYWEPATKNKYGNPATYTAGVEWNVRWQNVQVLFTDPQGEERQSSAIVYYNSTSLDARINGRLWLGRVASLSAGQVADPTLVENTWRIQQEQDSPSMSAGDTLGKVFL